MATLNVRPIDDAAALRIRLAAIARGYTLGVYMEKVSRLHAEVLNRPDLAALLNDLGLGKVEV